MPIINGTGIEGHKRSISKFCMDQSVKVRLAQGAIIIVKTGAEVRQGCCLSPILFNVFREYLTKEATGGFGDFKIEVKATRTAKYADDLALLTKKETVLQGTTDRLIESGRCYEM